MPLWPFRTVASKARGALLTANTLNQLVTNTYACNSLFAAEHTRAGFHNALEVPRAVGNAVYSGSYSLNGFQSRVTLNSHPAVGSLRYDLSSTYFPQTHGDFVVLSNVRNLSTKPAIVSHQVVDGDLYTYSEILESALGAGNTWGPSNLDIDLAIFAPAFADTSAALDSAFYAPPGSTLVPGTSYAQLYPMIRSQAAIYENVQDEHASNGTHNTIHVARAIGLATYSGSWSVETSNGISSISGVSTGVVDVTISNSYSTLQCGFAQVTDGVFGIVCCNPTSSTVFRCYIYEYSGGNWAAADKSFFFSAFEV